MSIHNHKQFGSQNTSAIANNLRNTAVIDLALQIFADPKKRCIANDAVDWHGIPVMDERAMDEKNTFCVKGIIRFALCRLGYTHSFDAGCTDKPGSYLYSSICLVASALPPSFEPDDYPVDRITHFNDDLKTSHEDVFLWLHRVQIKLGRELVSLLPQSIALEVLHEPA